MTDPLESLLVVSEWHPIGIGHDRDGQYMREAVTGNGITLVELVSRYNYLLSERQTKPAPAGGEARP